MSRPVRRSARDRHRCEPGHRRRHRRAPRGGRRGGRDRRPHARRRRRANLAGQPRGDGRARSRAYGDPVAVVAADLTDGDDRGRIVPEAVEQLGGPIDVLVNNAAAAMYALPSEMPLKRRRHHVRGQRPRAARPRAGGAAGDARGRRGMDRQRVERHRQARSRPAVQDGGPRLHHRHVRLVEGGAEPRDQRAGGTSCGGAASGSTRSSRVPR